MEGRSEDIEAEIAVLPAEEGGHPVFSDYRAQVHYDGLSWEAWHHYDAVAAVFPGQTAVGYLTFLSPECHAGMLYPGKRFLVCEGKRVIARGRVTRIWNLENAAALRRAERKPWERDPCAREPAAAEGCGDPLVPGA